MRKVALVAWLLLAALQGFPAAQRPGYPADEFATRRQALMVKVHDGFIVLFGEAMAPGGSHVRQDNDFFYLTGLDDVGAVLVMVPKTGSAYLFLPAQTPREKMIEGPNLLEDPVGAKTARVTAVHPVTYLDEFLARNGDAQGATFHVRLSPRDTIDNARSETDLFYARRSRLHYNDALPLDYARIAKLRERYPRYAFTDVTPLVDEMRIVKTPAEIEILRRNGAISAEGVRQAMLATRAGGFEYELEGAAMGTVIARGATGAAYAPIVGSGPNTCIWHYADNARQMANGDLVLMDFGADVDHLAMDITRTWPVSGAFTAEQRRVYQAVLEVEKACIEAYRPGATAETVRAHVADVLKRKGIDPQGLTGGFGHGVGLATHDVGPIGPVLREGMVFAIEPALYFPEKNLGVRIEDTVLITKDGCEVLTRGVPKEIDEVESLLAKRRQAP